MICIAPFGLGDYHVALHASIGLIRPKMDQPQSADLTLGSLQAKGTETEPDAIGEFENVQAERIAAGRLVVSDKSLGLQRPQNVVRGAAMETGEARDLAGIQRPLRAVQDAQHFCRRDDRAYRFARIAPDEFSGAESLLAVLRRSGLMDLARPLMHAISDAHGVSVYVSKVQGPSSLLLLDWVGVAFRTDLYVTVGRPSPVPAGASGVIMAAFGGSSEPELEALFLKVAWYQKPSFAEFVARVKEAKKCGFAVDRGAMFQGITLVSVPVLSPSWELQLILTAAGHSHDLDAKALDMLSRAMQSAATRLSESARLLRLA